MQYSQEHLKTMVYAEFGGQTECIMGDSKIENADHVSSFVYHIWAFWRDLGNSKRSCKIRRKIWGFNGLSFTMFRPTEYSLLIINLSEGKLEDE